MGELKFVKPVAGATVRHPYTMTPVPETGQTVPWDGPEGSYWRARVMDGSLVLAAAPASSATVPSSTADEAIPEKRRRN